MIDVLASQPWYIEHLRPIVAELGPAVGRVREGRLFSRDDPHPDTVALVCSYGDLASARRMRYRRFALAQHGAGQSYGGDPTAPKADSPSYPGGRSQADVGLFLVPNDHAADRWRAAYPGARVEVVGCPKIELLPAREPGPGPVVAFSFHWDYAGMPEQLSAWREYHTILPDIARRWAVIGHRHPRRTDLVMGYRRLGIESVGSFDEVCRQADVYVCDNSSTIFEFASTGRPVVLLNAKAYRRHINHGLRFWTEADVGVQVDDRCGLADAIERALELRPADVAAREAAVDRVYRPRAGSAKLAADALRSYAGLT